MENKIHAPDSVNPYFAEKKAFLCTLQSPTNEWNVQQTEASFALKM